MSPLQEKWILYMDYLIDWAEKHKKCPPPYPNDEVINYSIKTFKEFCNGFDVDTIFKRLG